MAAKKMLVVAFLLLTLTLAACQDAAPTPASTPLPPEPVAEEGQATAVPAEQPATQTAEPPPTETAEAPLADTAEPPPTETAAVETALGPDVLGNLTYSSEMTAAGTAALVGGEYREQAAPDSATETAVMLSEYVAFGELDGRALAAVVLITDPGGSGTFYSLHIVGLEEGRPQELAAELLGDRVEINSIAFENDQVVLDMVVAGPDDPLCCPTLGVTRAYELQDGTLALAGEEAAGDAQDGTAPALINVYWQWTGRQGLGGDDQAAPANPEDYVLLLHEDGSYQLEADCNRASGFYTAGPEGEIAFRPSMNTVAECDPDSLSSLLLDSLLEIERYEVDAAGEILQLFWRDGNTVDSYRQAGTAVPLESGLQIDPALIELDLQGLYDNWTVTFVPARPVDSSGPPGPQGLPDHLEFYFDYEDAAERNGGAIMYVIPVNDYIELWELAGDDSLADRINAIYDFARQPQTPPPTSGVPALPFEELTGVNDLAVQIGPTGAGPESASITGYRFVGRHMQDANPVTNQGLRYIYQGFTNDGKYLVAFFNPVRTDELADGSGELPQETLDSFNADPQLHISQEAQRLNALPPDAWQADLSALDALANSLRIVEVPPSGLQGPTWLWTGDIIDSTTGAVTSNALSGDYSAQFGGDSVLSIVSDCNLASSNYELKSPGMAGEMVIQPPLSTLAECGPDSFSAQFIGALQAAQAYRVLPGGEEMILTLPAANSEYRLRDTDAPVPAGEGTAEVGQEPRQPVVQSGTVSELFDRGFEFDVTGVARTYAWTIVPESAIGEGPGGEGFPRHILVTFDGEEPERVLANNGRRMYIFPIQYYLDLYDNAGDSRISDQVVRLQSLIESAQGRREPPRGEMPLLPPPPGPMDRWAQYRDYDFQSGMGVRYVADSPFRQSAGVWGSDTTAYYYQGLSSDGKYYISLWHPVSTTALPASAETAPPEVQRAAGNPETYPAYVAETAETLNGLNSEAFLPDLARLDAMIGSLKIGE